MTISAAARIADTAPTVQTSSRIPTTETNATSSKMKGTVIKYRLRRDMR
jgi:hypothetical protein